MDRDEYGDWTLEDRDHRATPERDVTAHCRAEEHDDKVRMRPVEDADNACERPACGTIVRVEVVRE